MLCSDLLHLPVVKKKSHILSSENYGKPEDSSSELVFILFHFKMVLSVSELLHFVYFLCHVSYATTFP